MKRLQYILVSLGFLWIMPIQALATTLWYNGDYNSTESTSNYYSTLQAGNSKIIFDDFIVSAGGWTVDGVWSNNLISDSLLEFMETANFQSGISEAFWEIRTGDMSTGGTFVAGGTASASLTATGLEFLFDGSLTREYTLSVSGLNVSLSEGDYWLAVAPVIYWADFLTGLPPWISGTSGTNSVGMPAGNGGNAYLLDGTASFKPWPNSGEIDYSMGISGTGDIVGGTAATPVPAPILLLATGLTGLAGFRSRLMKKNK